MSKVVVNGRSESSFLMIMQKWRQEDKKSDFVLFENLLLTFMGRMT